MAIAPSSCGGDDTTRSSWLVRVKSVQMVVGGVDRSIYYQLTNPTVQVTINPKNLTVASARADRGYNATNVATVGDLSLNGTVDGDNVQLTGDSSHGTFADATVGVNKPVTLSGDLALSGSARFDYVLTNPQPTIVGTISKADAVLSMSASPNATLLTSGDPITITATVRDRSTGNAPDGSAGVAPVVLTSDSTNVCTISDTTVTVHAAGTCVILGRQAA